MRNQERLTAVIGLILMGVTAGCIRPWGPEDIRRDLSAEAGVSLDREVGITVTRSGVMLARWGLRVSGEDEIPLKGVRRVEVGVYRVEESGDDDAHEQLNPPKLEGWQTILRARQDDESVFMMARLRDDEIRKILLVVAERDEWVIVRIHGKLQQILEETIRMAFDEADRPELYDTTEREPGWEKS